MSIKHLFSSLFETWFVQEWWATIKLFAPIAIGYGLDLQQARISLLFCGHAPKNAAHILEAAGLAGSVINITSAMIAMGMGVAMDTLAAQAWGAGNHKKIGVYLQRGILIQALTLLLVVGIWANIESILNLLHQPPCAVSYTIVYIHGYTFALPAVAFYYLLQKYLQAQGIVYPFIISGCIAMLVNVLAHYLLLFVADLGILGAGIAMGLTQYAGLVTILLVIWIRKLHKVTWDGWSCESLKDWGQYMKYSIPGMFILYAESGSYEVGMFVVGLTGSLQQSVYTVLESYSFGAFFVTYALQSAASVRVGNAMGEGSPKRAKRAMFVILCIAFSWLAIMEVVTLALKDYIPFVYTSDPTIPRAITVHMYVVAVTIFGDALNGSLAGTIVGCGWQSLAIGLNVLCYWVVGTPLAVVLALVVHLGALGYWIGQATGACLLCCSYAIVTATLNWKKQSEVALKMAALQKKERNCQDSTKSSVHSTNTPEQCSSSSSETSHKPVESVSNINSTEDVSGKGEPCSIAGGPSNPPVKHDAPSSPQGGRRKSTKHRNIEDVSKDEKKSMIRCSIGWKVVMLRVLTVAICVILCAGGVVTGQMFIYGHAPCNVTMVGNETVALQALSTSVPGCTITTSAVANVAHLLSPTLSPTYTTSNAEQSIAVKFRV